MTRTRVIWFIAAATIVSGAVATHAQQRPANGLKVVKSYVDPVAGKLNRETAPVLHFVVPQQLAVALGAPRTVKVPKYKVEPSAHNQVFVPAAPYVVQLGFAEYASVSSAQRGAAVNTYSISGLRVGPLHLRVNAKEGFHYYFFVPVGGYLSRAQAEALATLDPARAADPVLEQVAEALHEIEPETIVSGGRLLYGLVRACGLETNHELSAEEYDAVVHQGSTAFGRIVCDELDIRSTPIGEQRGFPTEVVGDPQP